MGESSASGQYKSPYAELIELQLCSFSEESDLSARDIQIVVTHTFGYIRRSLIYKNRHLIKQHIINSTKFCPWHKMDRVTTISLRLRCRLWKSP
jgi:hypothetical protein